LLTSDRGNYTGVDTTQKLTISATPTLASSGSNQFTTLNFSTAVNAATSLTDSYAIEFGGVAASSATAGSQTEVNAKEVRIAGIEAVSVVSEGTGFVANAIKLDDANVRTLTVTGSKDLTLTFSSNAGFGATPNTSTGIGGVSSIDASAATGVITINTTNVVGATAGLTVQTGSGNDVITLAQAATVIAGTGNDNITTTTAKATLTLGDGVDTVTVASSVVGTLSTPPTEAEVTGRVITVTDLAVGDKIDFSTNTVTAYALGLAQTTTATTLLGALNAINNATAQIAWGVYAGNT
jgi:S-layer protein